MFLAARVNVTEPFLCREVGSTWIGDSTAWGGNERQKPWVLVTFLSSPVVRAPGSSAGSVPGAFPATWSSVLPDCALWHRDPEGGKGPRQLHCGARVIGQFCS